MQFDQIVNTTGSPLTIRDESGGTRVLNPSRVVARAEPRRVRLSDAIVDGMAMPVHGIAYHVTGLPEPRPGVSLVVSWRVAMAAPDRTDLLVRGPVVCDEQKQVIGCKGLSVPNHPVARITEPRVFCTMQQLEELLLSELEALASERCTPCRLALLAFDRGLMSEEEMDLAQAQFGEAWASRQKAG